MLETQSLSLHQPKKNYYKIIDDKGAHPEKQQRLSSFYVSDDVVLTLEMTTPKLMTLDFYLNPSMQHINRTQYLQECDQAFIVSKNSIICQDSTQIYRLDITSKQELIKIGHLQAHNYIIVGFYHSSLKDTQDIEIYYQNNESRIKCVRFDQNKCLNNFQNIIEEKKEEELIFIRIQKQQSLLITKHSKNNFSSIQELVKSSKIKRNLNKFPLFGANVAGSTIQTISIPLGKSNSITFPNIVDEDTSKVKVWQDYKSIPYSTEKTKDQKYQFDPALTAFTDLGTHKMTVKLTDEKKQETTYYYSITYTNSPPSFSGTPSTTITTTFNQQVTLNMPAASDPEGHDITVTGIPSTTPYITYDAKSSKFTVNPKGAGECGKTTFNYQLTDTNLKSVLTYSMTVEVKNSQPTFALPYTLQPTGTPYKLHVMKSLALKLPGLTDTEGGQIVVNPSDTPGPSATALVLTHDAATNTLNIQSTQSQNCGLMNATGIDFYGISNHKINLRVQDLCSSYTDYEISVDISNTAPIFDPPGFTIASVEIPMNSVYKKDLTTNIKDVDGDTISIGFAQMINSVAVSVPPMFSVIAPATINMNPTTFAEVGLYNLRVEIFDYQPYSSFLYFDVTVINSPPVFLKNETMYKQKVRFNNTYEYLLLPYEDPEGSQVYFSQSSIPVDINQFAKFFPLINPDRIIIYPNQWNQVKTFQVVTIMTDTNKQSDYKWDLEIFNSPPYFNGGKKPANQKLRFNSTVQYSLPQFSDDEFNQIDFINNMPKFITFDSKQSSYLIAPINPANDIGTFNVIGKLSDSQMETDFKFTVTVFNDPPFFKQPLMSNINVGVGFNHSYVLPEAEDKEGMKFTVKTQIKLASGPLPPFIQFSAKDMQFDFSPDKLTQIGSYDIEVILDDSFSQKNVYKFRLNIQDPNKNKKNASNTANMVLVKASFKILSVSRDGKCSIKILASKGADQLTKFITHDTFKIVILTKMSQPVQYTIESKDTKQNIVTLKLKFKDPQKISDSTEFDRIEVRVDREPQFESKELLCYIPYDTKQQASVPPQVNSLAASFAAKFKGGVQLMSSSTAGGMAANLSISFIIQYIWGLLNDMSFLTINAMISITVPGTAKLIQMALLNFIYLDILQTDKWLIPLLFKEVESSDLDLQEEDLIDPINLDGPLNDYFDENGFSNKYIIENLGSTFVYFVFLLGSLILVPILTPLESLCSLIKRFSLWLKKHMIWNFTLRFLVQQAPPISIACGINFYLLSFSKFDGTSISSVLSLIFIFCICAGKVIVFLILRKYQRNKLLLSRQFQATYGTLVDGLNLGNNIGIYWNLLILIRWSLTNTVLIILRDHNYGQILCLLIFSYIYQVLMVYGKPYDDKLENQINLFNEVMVSGYLYVLMMLTDYLGDNLHRVEQGTVLVVIIMTNVGINFTKFFYGVFKGIKSYCRRKYLERLQADKLAKEKAYADEKLRQLEEIAKILSNPKFLDPNYIPTIDEEQALANRKLLFQGDPSNFSPELKAMIDQINKMRFGIYLVDTGNGFDKIMKNWKGSNLKQEIPFETPIQTSRFPTNIKKVDDSQKNNPLQLKADNIITKQNIRNLFKKQKQYSKKGKKGKSPVMNNNDQKNQWNFEDDYNANQYDQEQFQSGETHQTNYPFKNTRKKLFENETNQEIEIKTTAINLIEEELKQRNQLKPNLTFRFQSSKQENKHYEPQQWWAKR